MLGGIDTMKRVLLCIALIVLFSIPVHADQFRVSWKPNPTADSVLFYHVYSVTGTDTALIATVTAPDTFYVTGQIESGETCVYLVKAQNRFGYSSFSNEVSGIFLTPELDALCHITSLEVNEDNEAIISWHSEQPSVGGLQYMAVGADEWVLVLQPDFFLLPPVQDHEYLIPIERGYLWAFRAICYPGAEWNLIVSLVDTLDVTGTAPEQPEVEIRPF